MPTEQKRLRTATMVVAALAVLALVTVAIWTWNEAASVRVDALAGVVQAGTALLIVFLTWELAATGRRAMKAADDQAQAAATANERAAESIRQAQVQAQLHRLPFLTLHAPAVAETTGERMRFSVEMLNASEGPALQIELSVSGDLTEVGMGSVIPESIGDEQIDVLDVGGSRELSFTVQHMTEDKSKPIYKDGAVVGYQPQGRTPPPGETTIYPSVKFTVRYLSLMGAQITQTWQWRPNRSFPGFWLRTVSIDPNIPAAEPIEPSWPPRG